VRDVVDAGPAHPFAPGQVWIYRTRPNEEGSRLIIGSVDVVSGETVVSVCVTGARIRNPRRPDGIQEMLPHTPVAAATLVACVIELCGEAEVPAEFAEGYQVWREGVEWGNSTFFTIPVAEILTLAEQVAPQ
jgi:hypothetical protein